MPVAQSLDGRLAILTSGGDCPGLNAVIRAVAKSVAREGVEVFGILEGFTGLELRGLGRPQGELGADGKTTDFTFTVNRPDYKKALEILNHVSADLGAREVVGDDQIVGAVGPQLDALLAASIPSLARVISVVENEAPRARDILEPNMEQLRAFMEMRQELQSLPQDRDKPDEAGSTQENSL